MIEKTWKLNKVDQSEEATIFVTVINEEGEKINSSKDKNCGVLALFQTF